MTLYKDIQDSIDKIDEALDALYNALDAGISDKEERHACQKCTIELADQRAELLYMRGQARLSDPTVKALAKTLKDQSEALKEEAKKLKKATKRLEKLTKAIGVVIKVAKAVLAL